MPDPHEKLEQVIEASKEAIRGIGESFDSPDDDWLPSMLMLTGEDTMGLVGIDTEFLASPLTKQMLTEQVIPELLREHNAVAAVFTSSAWLGTYSPEDMPPSLPPAMQPDRRECVMITGATAFEAKSLTAPITRYEDKPPTLGEWTEFSGDPEGMFPEALRHGLARQG